MNSQWYFPYWRRNQPSCVKFYVFNYLTSIIQIILASELDSPTKSSTLSKAVILSAWTLTSNYYFEQGSDEILNGAIVWGERIRLYFFENDINKERWMQDDKSLWARTKLFCVFNIWKYANSVVKLRRPPIFLITVTSVAFFVLVKFTLYAVK